MNADPRSVDTATAEIRDAMIETTLRAHGIDRARIVEGDVDELTELDRLVHGGEELPHRPAPPPGEPTFQRWLQHELVRQENDLHRVRLLERRWDIWRRVLVREPVAVVIGSLILLLLTVTLVVATMAGIPVPEILTNAFLVLLGYFFGHTVMVHRSGP